MSIQSTHRPGRPSPALSRRALLAGTAAGAVGGGPSASGGRADDGALPCRCRSTLVRGRPLTPTPSGPRHAPEPCRGTHPHHPLARSYRRPPVRTVDHQFVP